jgi:hypothetical protein
VAVIGLWLGFELYQGGGALWVGIAACFLAYALYTFFLTWPGDDGTPPA